MKTILHITEVSSGGVLPVIAGLCNGMADDYKVIFAYGIRFDTPRNIDRYFDKRVLLLPIEEFTRTLNVKSDLKATKRVQEIIKKYNPDVVHMHSSKAGYCGRMALIGNKCLKLYSPHGYSFLKSDNSISKKIIYLIAEWVLALFGSITVACSESELRIAKKINKKAVCLLNCLDVEFVDSNMTAGEHKGLKAYAAGRISPQKAPEKFNDFSSRFPDIDFIWIGGGCDENGLTSSNIIVTGIVSREDVIKKACECDYYLSFSPSEGLPVALLEAMYMKKICLVSNVCGNNDLIDDETGYLFDSVDECERILRSILKDSSEAKKRANRAHEKVLEEYTIDKMQRNYNGLIGDMLWN